MTFAFSRDGAVPGHNLWRRLGKNKTPTWAVFFVVLAAFIIISGGVTGLYVGKIFDQVKGRPLFVVDDIAGGQEGDLMARETAAATLDAPGSESDPPAAWS